MEWAKENGIESSVRLKLYRERPDSEPNIAIVKTTGTKPIVDVNHLLHVASYDPKSYGPAQWRRTFQNSPRILRKA